MCIYVRVLLHSRRNKKSKRHKAQKHTKGTANANPGQMQQVTALPRFPMGRHSTRTHRQLRTPGASNTDKARTPGVVQYYTHKSHAITPYTVRLESRPEAQQFEANTQPRRSWGGGGLKIKALSLEPKGQHINAYICKYCPFLFATNFDF